jgi:phosphoglycolate phosphatase
MKLGIATNDNEASARAHVASLKIGQFVDFVAGYDSVRRAKPAGDMVYAFCRTCGLEPREVAVVGDNPHDLEMGHDAGAGLVIGVLTGNGGRDDFAGLADAVLGSVADLPAYLDGM